MDKKLTILALALALAAALPLASVAQKKAEVAGGAATAPGKAAAAAVVTAQGVIEAVDPKTREVKIKLANGETRTIVASEDVRNFDQIKVGDKLKAAQALESTPTGQATTWKNPDTGASYTMTPTTTVESPAGPCRDFTVNGNVDGKAETVTGTACRQADGSWKTKG